MTYACLSVACWNCWNFILVCLCAHLCLQSIFFNDCDAGVSSDAKFWMLFESVRCWENHLQWQWWKCILSCVRLCICWIQVSIHIFSSSCCLFIVDMKYEHLCACGVCHVFQYQLQQVMLLNYYVCCLLLLQPPFIGGNRDKIQQKIVKDRIKLPSFLSSEAHSLLKGVNVMFLYIIFGAWILVVVCTKIKEGNEIK